MLQIEKERSLAKPNQLPAGPRKKRPSGRLFSSYIYYFFVMVAWMRHDPAQDPEMCRRVDEGAGQPRDLLHVVPLCRGLHQALQGDVPRYDHCG